MPIFLNHPLMKHVPNKKQLTRNPLARLVAAEVEVAGDRFHDDYDPNDYDENCDGSGYGEDGDEPCGDDNCAYCCSRRRQSHGDWPVLAVMKKWSFSCVADGSLPSGGYELPLAPAGGDLWLQECDEVGRVLEQVRAKVTASCGLHIHADATDFTFSDMTRLMRLYAYLEDTLFDMVPTSRAEGSYARKCGDMYRKIAEAKTPHAIKHALADHLYELKLPMKPLKQRRRDRSAAKRARQVEALRVRKELVRDLEERILPDQRRNFEWENANMARLHPESYVWPVPAQPEPNDIRSAYYSEYVILESAEETRRRELRRIERRMMTEYGEAYSGMPDSVTVYREMKRDKYNNARYKACNLHSWLYRGTVELRLPSGTVQGDKIAQWGILWGTIVDTAMRLSYADIITRVRENEPRKFLLAILPEATRTFVKERWAQYGDRRQ